MLNVHCDGTHATYLDDTRVDLARYARGYVSVRYHYADRTYPYGGTSGGARRNWDANTTAIRTTRQLR